MDASPPAQPTPPEPNPYEPPHAPTGPPAAKRSPALSALATGTGVILVFVSSLIAFVGTCVPLGFVTLGAMDNPNARGLIVLPWLVGLACGAGAGVLTFRLIFRSKRRQATSPPPSHRTTDT